MEAATIPTKTPTKVENIPRTVVKTTITFELAILLSFIESPRVTPGTVYFEYEAMGRYYLVRSNFLTTPTANAMPIPRAMIVPKLARVAVAELVTAVKSTPKSILLSPFERRKQY
jgi:hypothetical protein